MMNKLALVNALSLVFAWGLITWTILDRFHRSELTKLYDVQVLKRYSTVDLCLAVKEAQQGPYGEFSAHMCDPLESDVVEGVLLKKLYYTTDSHLHCLDWRNEKAGAGYTVWRNNAKEPILSTFSGSSTASCQTIGPAETAKATEARAR